MRDLLLGHAHAGVLDHDLHPGAVGLDADVDGAAFGRVEVRVGQQIGHDLAYPAGIGQGRRRHRGGVGGQVLALGLTRVA